VKRCYMLWRKGKISKNRYLEERKKLRRYLEERQREKRERRDRVKESEKRRLRYGNT